MNIYRLSQTVNTGQYGHKYYDHIIVIAKNKAEARLMRPSLANDSKYIPTRNLDAENLAHEDIIGAADLDAYGQEETWVRNPDDVSIEEIGSVTNSNYAHPMILTAHRRLPPIDINSLRR